jgi:spore coat polysaccharide biosynthesis predicted glycosyltransferase SpsG/RimJ/RimL family protein N-acetyltransferase
MNGRLLIRADASSQMGTGHVMRCIALAQAWLRRGGAVQFLMASSTPAIQERLSKERLPWRTLDAQLGSSLDARETAAAAREWNAGFVAMDGYHFGWEHQKAVIDLGARLLFFDDYGHGVRYCADLVLNQNLGADEALYKDRDPRTQLLLGNRYVLLRREFLRWSGVAHPSAIASTNEPKTANLTIENEHESRTESAPNPAGPRPAKGSIESAAKDTGRGAQTSPGHDSTFAERVLTPKNVKVSAVGIIHPIDPVIQRVKPDFVEDLRRQAVTSDKGLRLLVTMGGSDPDNVTTRVIDALEEAPLKGGHAFVVVGPANPFRAQIEAAAARSSWTVELISPASDFPERMASVDLAVSAGGTTCWELAFMGVPAMVVVLADNQNVVAQALHAAGAAQNLGPAANLSTGAIGAAICTLARDPAGRQEMAQKAQALIDGEGADRVVMFLGGDPFRLRPVRAADCRIIWEWANEPATRAASFASDPIPWERHQSWFADRLASAECRFYIAVDHSENPVGQVRFELDPSGVAVIGVSLDHRYRGQGWGAALLALAASRLFADSNARRIDAFVKEKNQASLAAFEKAGYIRHELAVVQGHPAWRLSLERPTILKTDETLL